MTTARRPLDRRRRTPRTPRRDHDHRGRAARERRRRGGEAEGARRRRRPRRRTAAARTTATAATATLGIVLRAAGLALAAAALVVALRRRPRRQRDATRRRPARARGAARRAPVALAHEGNPNYRSVVDGDHARDRGVTVEILNLDDRLLLHNTSDEDVVILGYDDEPYAQVLADGTVQVNTDSKAYYLNEDRSRTSRCRRASTAGEPQWKEVAKTGRFEWHDHRAHWMGKGDAAAAHGPGGARRRSTTGRSRSRSAASGRDRRHAALDPAGRRRPAARRDLRRRRLLIVCCIAVFIVRHRRGGAAERPRRRRRGEARASACSRSLALLLAPRGAAPPTRTRCWRTTVPERGAQLDAAPARGRAALRRGGRGEFGALRVFDARRPARSRTATPFHPAATSARSRSSSRRPRRRQLHGDLPRGLRRRPPDLGRLRVHRRQGRRARRRVARRAARGRRARPGHVDRVRASRARSSTARSRWPSAPGGAALLPARAGARRRAAGLGAPRRPFAARCAAPARRRRHRRARPPR